MDTGRLRLRPVESVDPDGLSALVAHPDIRRAVGGGGRSSRQVASDMIADSRDPASLTAFWLMSTAAAAGAGIGIIGLNAPSTALGRLRAIGWRSLELVVALHPSAQGRGLAREAIEAVAQHALGDGVTFALLCAVDEPNTRAHALMARCGFRELDRLSGGAHARIVYERSL